MLDTFIRPSIDLYIKRSQSSSVLMCKAKCLQHNRLRNIALTSYHAKWVLSPRIPALSPRIPALAVGKVTHPAPKLEILTPSAPSPFTSNLPWSPKQFTSSVCLKACGLLVHPAYLFIRD